MRMNVVRPKDLAEDHLVAWRRFQQCDPFLASPFLGPEFTQLVATVRPDCWTAIVEDGGGLRGFFPFQRRRRVGRPIAGGLSDCQAVVAAPGWDFDARALIRAAGLAVYDFTHMRAGQRAFVPFHRTVSTSPVIDLAEGGFDAYAQERRAAGRNVVTQTMSHARRLERQLGPLRFAMHDPDPRSLELLIAWKRQQYRQDRWGGALDVFSHPWAVELLERLHSVQSAGFAGVLSTLSAGDRMIAAHMGMRSSSVLHYWFPAYDDSYSKLAPGRILLLEMIRAAPAAGIRAIELGAGDEGYKDRFANDAIPVATGFVGTASVPLLRRHLRHGAEAAARRLLVGRAGQRAAEFFFRAEWEQNHR